MQYFPVCLQIEGRRCIVIGGGKVAERKAKGLLECGAALTVVSPELTGELAALYRAGDLRWVDRAYQQGDLEGAFLVIAATDDPEVQRRVHAEAEERNIPLNVADVPKWCNFILPATLRRGDLAISISTAGKSPALASKFRQDFEGRFGEEYAAVLDLLGELRAIVLARGESQVDNKRLFQELVEEDIAAMVRGGEWEGLRRHVVGTLGMEAAGVCVDALRQRQERRR